MAKSKCSKIKSYTARGLCRLAETAKGFKPPKKDRRQSANKGGRIHRRK